MARILIVDDERHIRLLYALELADEGFEIKTASSKDDLITLINDFQPHVLLLDLYLTGCNGFELLQIARAHNRRLIIIICTTDDMFNCELISSVANGFVVKSNDLDSLKHKIINALNRNIISGSNGLPLKQSHICAHGFAI